MATVANTSWYRTGSVEVTKNSPTITGTNTRWASAGINPGATFRIDEDLKPYEVLEVVDDTHITLRTPFLGTTGTGKTYSIDRNFQSTPMANLCADVASVMHKYETHIDAETNTITGKSAYQIACDKGYVGTESEWVKSLEGASAYEVAVANGYEGTAEEWLEALKAAGEWADADSRLDALETKTMKDALINDESITLEQRNAIYGGRNLGVFTEDHYKALTQQNGKGLAVGDVFSFPSGANDLPTLCYWGDSYRIVGFKTIIPGKASMALMPDHACGMGTWARPYAASYNSAAIGTEAKRAMCRQHWATATRSPTGT